MPKRQQYTTLQNTVKAVENQNLVRKVVKTIQVDPTNQTKHNSAYAVTNQQERPQVTLASPGIKYQNKVPSPSYNNGNVINKQIVIETNPHVQKHETSHNYSYSRDYNNTMTPTLARNRNNVQSQNIMLNKKPEVESIKRQALVNTLVNQIQSKTHNAHETQPTRIVRYSKNQGENKVYVTNPTAQNTQVTPVANTRTVYQGNVDRTKNNVYSTAQSNNYYPKYDTTLTESGRAERKSYKSIRKSYVEDTPSVNYRPLNNVYANPQVAPKTTYVKQPAKADHNIPTFQHAAHTIVSNPSRNINQMPSYVSTDRSYNTAYSKNSGQSNFAHGVNGHTGSYNPLNQHVQHNYGTNYSNNTTHYRR